MVAGHFGFAAGVKSGVPSVPLWALLLATQWLDVFFVPLYLMGIETIEPVDPAHPNAYGGGVIHAVYTHSLVGALVLSVIAGGLAWSRWGRRAGVVIGGVAFSHWLLDLVVHRADLPLLPGNAGGFPELGFGLWRNPTASAIVELALVLVGAYLYHRRATALPATGSLSPAELRRRTPAATGVVTGLMVLCLAGTLVGL
jgi:hypothetical protein